MKARMIAAGLGLILAAPATAQDNPGAGGLHAPAAATGAEVYRQVCAACHMQDARGGAGAGTVPALAGNRKLGVAAYPVMVVLNGQGGMPWLRDMLTPTQIAAVLTYVRTSFGNSYPAPVTEAEVARIAAVAPRP